MERRHILKKFQSKGLSITSEAIKALCRQLDREDDRLGSVNLIFDAIKERIDKNELNSSTIGIDVLKKVISDLSTSGEDMKEQRYQLIDAFKCPRITYDERRRSYNMEINPQYSLTVDVSSRARMYRERLLMAQQRVYRRTKMKPKGLSAASAETTELSSIETLLGDTGIKNLMGIITQPEEGVYYLEDLTGNIALDLSNVRNWQENRLFTEGCIVLCSGEISPINQNLFIAEELMMPPKETRQKTLDAMDIIDPFGNEDRPDQIKIMQNMEEHSSDDRIIIFSDVTFSKDKVCENLKKAFEYYNRVEGKFLFVIIGPFSTKDFTCTGGREEAERAFEAFADTLSECSTLCAESKFLLVPSMNDPGIKAAWPKRALSEHLVEKLRKRIQHLSLASNPCHVRFFTQDIVLFRDDLLRRMMRNVIFCRNTGESEDAPEVEESTSAPPQDLRYQLVNTLLDQAHLFPLAHTAKPIYWELDHSMRLGPLPHLLILADKTEDFIYKAAEDCIAVNPGSFAVDSCFVEYNPSTKEVEPCKV